MSEETTQEQPDARSLEERILARLDSIDSRITRLEAKEYDTKPIWERAMAEIERISTELQIGLRRVGDKIDALNKNILEMQADQREIERRLNKLESEGNVTLIQ